MRWSSLIPNETNAPLVIDPDRILPVSIRPQCLKAISGRHAEIAQHPRLIQKTKLSQSDILNVSGQSSAPTPRPDQFGLGIGKVLNHERL
jgi:hypothetical protein